jgi:hypothetical protein
VSKFFDVDVATSLQFFRLLMELIGFALALIEVRVPSTAQDSPASSPPSPSQLHGSVPMTQQSRAHPKPISNGI